jgi:hypothetical protein
MQPLDDAVLERIGVGQGTELLDAGCGSGLAAQLAARRGAIVTGLDATPELLAIVRRRVPASDGRHSSRCSGSSSRARRRGTAALSSWPATRTSGRAGWSSSLASTQPRRACWSFAARASISRRPSCPYGPVIGALRDAVRDRSEAELDALMGAGAIAHRIGLEDVTAP